MHEMPKYCSSKFKVENNLFCRNASHTTCKHIYIIYKHIQPFNDRVKNKLIKRKYMYAKIQTVTIFCMNESNIDRNARQKKM